MNLPPETLATQLAASRERFVAFARSRTRDAVTAEESVHEAVAQALARADALRDPAKWEAWFFRILRNVIVDRARRGRTEARAAEALAHEPEHAPAEVGRGCTCVLLAVDRLKPEYGEALRRVAVDGVELRRYAEERGITPNNAAVRLHRARASLHREVSHTCGRCADDGCRDCDCGH
ncbi:MAG: RNA polymerase sigma factor [Polyangiales bacterium]